MSTHNWIKIYKTVSVKIMKFKSRLPLLRTKSIIKTKECIIKPPHSYICSHRNVDNVKMDWLFHWNDHAIIVWLLAYQFHAMIDMVRAHFASKPLFSINHLFNYHHHWNYYLLEITYVAATLKLSWQSPWTVDSWKRIKLWAIVRHHSMTCYSIVHHEHQKCISIC